MLGGSHRREIARSEGGRFALSRVSEARPGAPSIVVDLAAVQQNSKSRKSGVNTVEIALSNIEKANLVPEI